MVDVKVLQVKEVEGKAEKKTHQFIWDYVV